MDFSPANQQLLRSYGKCYHFLSDTMLLDMIKKQVQNKYSNRIFSDMNVLITCEDTYVSVFSLKMTLGLFIENEWRGIGKKNYKPEFYVTLIISF